MAAVTAASEGSAEKAPPLVRMNLFATTKAAFRSMIKSCQSTMCVLVLDDHSTRVISSSMRMYDIMDEGVALVERLSLVRQKLPEMEALYLIEPTAESVAKLVRCLVYLFLSSVSYDTGKLMTESDVFYECFHSFVCQPNLALNPIRDVRNRNRLPISEIRRTRAT